MISAPVPLPHLMAAEFFGSAFLPAVVTGVDDRKAYYPGSRRIAAAEGDRRVLVASYACASRRSAPCEAGRTPGPTRQLRQEAATGR